MCVIGARSTITATVAEWDGVTVQPHRHGGTEFVIGRCEIGHIHGNQLVDIPFPKRIRDQIIAEGRANTHHVLPESGWVSCWLDEPVDVNKAIDLLRKSYEIGISRRYKRQPAVIKP